MARFDLYALRGGAGYLLDCQADIFLQMDSRFVVPLVPQGTAPPIAFRLNPAFVIGDETVVMVTQSASAISARLLRSPVQSLADHQDTIMNALDFLLTGY